MNMINKRWKNGSFALIGSVLGTLCVTAHLHGAGAPALPELDYDLVSQVDVQAVWRANCVGCHGANGKGQTRVGRRAGTKDFTDNAYQRSFSNAVAFKYTREGMTVDGDEKMKPFGKDFTDDNGLTDEEIMALILYIREFDPQWSEE